MSKWYEVTVKAWEVVVVELEDDEGEQEAAQAAFDEGAFTFVTEKEVDEMVLLDTPEKLERAKRHADEVSPLPVPNATSHRPPSGGPVD